MKINEKSKKHRKIEIKKLKIETPEPTAINIDGENIGSTPLNMEVLASEVKIFH